MTTPFLVFQESSYMRSLDPIPGASGIVWLVFAFLGVCGIMSMVTGDVWHWIPVIAGIIVGLMAVASINRR